MSQKKIKQQRRTVRKVVKEKTPEIFQKFANDLMKLPFKARLKIAWKILRGKNIQK